MNPPRPVQRIVYKQWTGFDSMSGVPGIQRAAGLAIPIELIQPGRTPA